MKWEFVVLHSYLSFVKVYPLRNWEGLIWKLAFREMIKKALI